MNQQILNLVGEGNFSGAISELEKLRTKVAKTMGTTSQVSEDFYSKLEGNITGVKRSLKSLFNTVDASKARDSLKGIDKELEAMSENLSGKNKAEIVSFFDEIVKGSKEVVAAISSGLPKGIFTAYNNELKKIQKKASLPTAETGGPYGTTVKNLNKLIQDGVMKVDSLTEKYLKIVDVVKREEEGISRINQKYRDRVVLVDFISKKNSDIVNIMGYAVDKSSALYKNNSKFKEALLEIAEAEKSINTIYDDMGNKQKEVIVSLLKQKAPLEALRGAYDRLKQIEKGRATELEVYSSKMKNLIEESGTLFKLTSSEEAKVKKINEDYRNRVASVEAIKNKHNEIINILGYEVDTSANVYKNNDKLRISLNGIAKAENTINKTYDTLSTKQRERISLLQKEGASNEVIKGAYKRLEEIEKGRANELESYSTKMKKLIAIMQQFGGMSKKELASVRGQFKALFHEAENTASGISKYGIAIGQLSDAHIRLGGSTTGLLREFSRMRNRLLVLTFAFGTLVRNIDKAIKMSIEFDKQITAMATVSTNLGLGITKVSESIEYLARDGVLTIEQASRAMKNLLSTGASLDIVVENIEAMKDAAIANGRAMFSAGENIEAYTQGVKEGRSQLTDSAGIMNNLSNVAAKYANEIKELGYANGILIGFTKEASMFDGVRAKLLDKLVGKTMILEAATRNLKIEIGKLFEPFSEKIVDLKLEYIGKAIEAAKTGAPIIESVMISTGEIVARVFSLFNIVKSLFVDIVFPLWDALIKISSIISKYDDTLVKILTVLVKINVYLKLYNVILGTISTKLAAVVSFFTSSNKQLRMTNELMAIKLGLEQKSLAVTIATNVARAATVLHIISVIALTWAIIKGLKDQNREQELLNKKIETRNKLTASSFTETNELYKVLEKMDRKGENTGIFYESYMDMVAKQKELVDDLRLTRDFDRMGDLIKKTAENNKFLKRANELYKNDLIYLEEHGVMLDYINNRLTITNAKGKVLVETSLDYWKALSKVKFEIDSQSRGILRLEEEALKTIRQSKEEQEQLNAKLLEIGKSSEYASILKFNTSFVKSIKDQKEALDVVDKNLDLNNSKLADNKKFLDALISTIGNKVTLDSRMVATLKELNTESDDFAKALEYISNAALDAGLGDSIETLYTVIKTVKTLNSNILQQNESLEILTENMQTKTKIAIKSLSEEMSKFSKSLDDSYTSLSSTFDALPNRIEELRNSVSANLKAVDSDLYKLEAGFKSIDRRIAKESSDAISKYTEGLDKLLYKIDETSNALTTWEIEAGKFKLPDADKSSVAALLSSYQEANKKLFEANEEYNRILQVREQIVNAYNRIHGFTPSNLIIDDISRDPLVNEKTLTEVTRVLAEAKNEYDKYNTAIQNLIPTQKAYLDILKSIQEAEIRIADLKNKYTDKTSPEYVDAIKGEYETIKNLEKQKLTVDLVNKLSQMTKDFNTKMDGKKSFSFSSIFLGDPKKNQADYVNWKNTITALAADMAKSPDMFSKELLEAINNLKREQDIALEHEGEFWWNYGDIVTKGMKNVINQFGSMSAQWVSATIDSRRKLAVEYASLFATLEKQHDLGLLSESYYAREKEKLDAKKLMDEKIANKNLKAERWKQLEDFAVTAGLQLLIKGLGETLMGPPAVAMGIALLASGAYAAFTATGKATEAAKYEAEQLADFANTWGDSTASAAASASTFGSTVEGAPRYYYINPTISITGENILVGEDVADIGTSFAEQIVSIVSDAFKTGDLD